MVADSLSVAAAAAVLGVHPQRIHQRIREGSLPAERVGHQWAVDASDLHRIKNQTRPGRPLSPRSAWDLLAVAANAPEASKLSPSARSRARSRLRNLLDDVASADLDDAAARLASALRNRANRALFAASPRDLPDLREDERIHLSGVSLRESNMSAGDLVEGYLPASRLGAFVDDYLLSPASHARANVVLHVIPADAAHPAHSSLIDLVQSPLALAADLAEHGGVRERDEALRRLADLRARMAEQTPADRGLNHG